MGSGLSGPLRRAVAILLCSGLITFGVAAVLAPQANASSQLFLTSSSAAVADSATPHKSQVDPATLPVGTHVDASHVKHTTKAYVTFDLSPLVGHELLTASFRLTETAVADCSATTVPQAWLTDTATAPTFAKPPAERTELTGPGTMFGCPDNFDVAWDAGQAIDTALAHGRRSATIEVRLSDADQSDPAHGLTFDPAAHLLVSFNILPGRPTAMTVGGRTCANTPVFVPANFPGILLSSTLTDPDDNSINVEFTWWPVAHPTQRTVIDELGISGSRTTATILQSALAEGTTYAWQVRGIDRNQSGQEKILDGPLSAVCQFTTDFTPPATAASVTSTDYPAGVTAGGVGVPGTFTLSGGGDPDVVGFTVGEDFVDVIPADHPGGTATVRLTPSFTGPSTLIVHTVDEVNNIGPETDYQYFVAENAPTATCDAPSVFLGQTIHCTFTDPDAITGYSYHLFGGPTVTVPAGPDGSTTVAITPTDPSVFGSLDVNAVLANGNLSDTAFTGFNIDTGAPTVDQSADEVVFGSPVDFTFHAVLPGSVSFTYTLFDGSPTTVPVGPDGTATVTIRPTESGAGLLEVFSTTAAGVQSGSADAFLSVDSNSPTVTSTDYPERAFSGGVGDPGTFTISSATPGVVSYTYSFNGAPPQTVPANADGTADVTFTPTEAFADNTLEVTSTFADGTTSDHAEYDFFANSTPPGVTCDGMTGGGAVGAGEVDCVFTALQQNATSFVYSQNSADPVTVPAGPDGTAAVTVSTADVSGPFLEFRLHSLNAEGDSSDETFVDFSIDSPAQADATHTAVSSRLTNR